MGLVVRFIALGTGEVVGKKLDSNYVCRKFVNKMGHLPKCRLALYSNFRD